MSFEDKRRYAARQLIQWIAARYPGGWDGLIRDARIKSTSAPDWKYGDEGTNPSGLHLVSAMQVVGLLDENFAVPKAMEDLAEAQRHANEAARRAEEFEDRAQDDPGRASSK